jgi:hypothetical protein
MGRESEFRQGMECKFLKEKMCFLARILFVLSAKVVFLLALSLLYQVSGKIIKSRSRRQHQQKTQKLITRGTQHFSPYRTLSFGGKQKTDSPVYKQLKSRPSGVAKWPSRPPPEEQIPGSNPARV